MNNSLSDLLCHLIPSAVPVRNTGPPLSVSCDLPTQPTAKLKLKLEEINQNPFRHSLLDSVGSGEDGGGGSNSDGGDTSEDMSWGFDQTFFGEEGDNDDDPDDYDDI